MGEPQSGPTLSNPATTLPVSAGRVRAATYVVGGAACKPRRCVCSMRQLRAAQRRLPSDEGALYCVSSARLIGQARCADGARPDPDAATAEHLKAGLATPRESRSRVGQRIVRLDRLCLCRIQQGESERGALRLRQPRRTALCALAHGTTSAFGLFPSFSSGFLECRREVANDTEIPSVRHGRASRRSRRSCEFNRRRAKQGSI